MALWGLPEWQCPWSYPVFSWIDGTCAVWCPSTAAVVRSELGSQVLQVFPGVTLWLSQMLCFSVLSTFNEVIAALKSAVIFWDILLSPLCLLKPHLHFVHPTLCLCACEILAVQSREQDSILPSQAVSVKIWLFNDALIPEQKKNYFNFCFSSEHSTFLQLFCQVNCSAQPPLHWHWDSPTAALTSH